MPTPPADPLQAVLQAALDALPVDRADASTAHAGALGRLLGVEALPEGLAPTLRRATLALGSRAEALDEALARWGGDRQSLAQRVGRLHQGLLGARRDLPGARRGAGVYYTPEATARWLAREALDGLRPTNAAGWRLGDPSCGCGAFLLAGLEVLAARGELAGARFHGVDLDGLAVEVTRALLWRALAACDPAMAHDAALQTTIQVGDGLEAPLPPLDAVLSNPPFGNAIEAGTARSEDERQRHRALLPEVAQGAYDVSSLFAARAAQRLRPGGRYGLVLPRSVLSLDSAGPTRALLGELAPPELLWAPETGALFEGADVFVALTTGTRAPWRPGAAIRVSMAPPGPDGGPDEPLRPVSGPPGATWMPLLLPERALMSRVEGGPVALRPVGELVTVQAGLTTAAAYTLRPDVVDNARSKGLKLITTGLIDRYRHHWGRRPCRFLKGTFNHPRWPRPSLDPALERGETRQRSPKILLGGLTRVLEAVADPRGELGGVVSTWVIRPRVESPGRLWLVEAWLNAPVVSLLYMTRFRGKELSGGNTTIGQRELVALPAPADLMTLPLGDPTPAPEGWGAVFSMDPTDEAHRRQLAQWASAAVERPSGSALPPSRDALAAACIAALYGLDLEDHLAILEWFTERCGQDLRPKSGHTESR